MLFTVHPFDTLENSRVRPRRNRNWERKHLNEKGVYRGVNPEFVQKIQRLADVLSISQGKVACSILEYAMRKYADGLLELVPRPNPNCMRMTLHNMPSRHHRETNMQFKSKSSKPSWRKITTWRHFSPELKRTISALASKEALNVPTGELINALLRYGLNAHEAGWLRLEPNEKATAQSLLEETKP